MLLLKNFFFANKWTDCNARCKYNWIPQLPITAWSLISICTISDLRVNFSRKSKCCEVHGFCQEPCLTATLLLRCSANSMWQWPTIAQKWTLLTSTKTTQKSEWRHFSVTNDFSHKSTLLLYYYQISSQDLIFSWFSQLICMKHLHITAF